MAVGAGRVTRLVFVALAALLTATATACSTGLTGPAAAEPRPSHSRGADSGGDASSGTPAPAVTGTVTEGVHKGDLRYFLLPLPEGAEASGDVIGDRMTLDEAAISHGAAALRDRGFRQGAHRAYHTADGAWEVDVKLVQLDSPTSARALARESGPQGVREAVPGDPRAQVIRLDSAAAESTGSLVAASYEGDVHITMTLTGATQADPGQLAALLERQYARLRTGR